MLVGATMGGKTTISHTLANALTLMEREKKPEQEPIDKDFRDSEISDENNKTGRTDRSHQ